MTVAENGVFPSVPFAMPSPTQLPAPPRTHSTDPPRPHAALVCQPVKLITCAYHGNKFLVSPVRTCGGQAFLFHRILQMQGDLPLEQYLAGVCNTIVLNGSVCQAFDYNTVSRIAYFKGQPPTLQIDYTTAACAFPNVTLWVLSSGEQPYSCCCTCAHFC